MEPFEVLHEIYCGKDPTFTYPALCFHKHNANKRICPYFFVNITVIHVHFQYFIFCFKFSYRRYHRQSPLYYFSICVKPIKNAVTKRKKPHSDIILV